MRHVRTHDELSQIVDSLLEGSDAILDLERTLQSLHAMIEVAVDAMLFNGCLVAGLVSSSSRIVGRLLLDGHAEWLHGVLMLVRERGLGLRMLSMLSVGRCNRSDVEFECDGGRQGKSLHCQGRDCGRCARSV